MLSFSGYRAAGVIRDLNPLAIQKITIPARSAKGKPAAKNETVPPSIQRLTNYLALMLKREFARFKHPHTGKKADPQPVPQPKWFTQLTPRRALELLVEQILKFSKSSYPFERKLEIDENPFQYWSRLKQEEAAQPLAVSIVLCRHMHRLTSHQTLAMNMFAVFPSSINDETTQSGITWLNSALRNQQKVATVGRLLLIRQYNMNRKRSVHCMHYFVQDLRY
jgi:hypothetical protein